LCAASSKPFNELSCHGSATAPALIGLGIACWPGPPLVGMLTYSALVALYLGYLGFAVGLTGIFLWPAVALHAILSVFLGRLWLAGDQQ
jgi:hypothetical protein